MGLLRVMRTQCSLAYGQFVQRIDLPFERIAQRAGEGCSSGSPDAWLVPCQMLSQRRTEIEFVGHCVIHIRLSNWRRRAEACARSVADVAPYRSNISRDFQPMIRIRSLSLPPSNCQ